MRTDEAISDGTVAQVMALFADYARHLDLRRDPQAWAELYRADGSLVTGAREINGRDALREFAVGSIPGVHVQAVPHLQARADGGLDSVTSFVFIIAATGDLRAGYYTDHLERDGDRYVFVRRQISMLVRTDAP
jgi:SnoaL-like domain